MKRLVLLTALAFLALTAVRAPAFQTIIIDAGHGGHDRGASPGQALCEKTLALDVAQRVAEKLRESGIKAVMTRSNDTFISLDRRVDIANAHTNALFVSIHFNSAWRRGAHGFETFYYHPRAEAIAVRVNDELETVRKGEDRGAKKRGFYVLRRSRIPAILVECGFLTNPQEAVLCQKASYREELAEAIVRGIKKSMPNAGASQTAPAN